MSTVEIVLALVGGLAGAWAAVASDVRVAGGGVALAALALILLLAKV